MITNSTPWPRSRSRRPRPPPVIRPGRLRERFGHKARGRGASIVGRHRRRREADLAGGVGPQDGEAWALKGRRIAQS
eukprot:7023084-Alexandrium_andersonii.AAC.1